MKDEDRKRGDAACCLPGIGIIIKNIFYILIFHLIVQLSNAGQFAQNISVQCRKEVHFFPLVSSGHLALRTVSWWNWVRGVGKREGNWAGGDRKREAEK